MALSDTGDWRLQAPKREKAIKFKPGANTWDTDDYTNPEDESKKRKRSLQDTISNPTGFDPNGGKPNPKEAYEPNVKHETAVETTGTRTAQLSVIVHQLNCMKLTGQIKRLSRVLDCSQKWAVPYFFVS